MRVRTACVYEKSQQPRFASLFFGNVIDGLQEDFSVTLDARDLVDKLIELAEQLQEVIDDRGWPALKSNLAEFRRLKLLVS